MTPDYTQRTTRTTIDGLVYTSTKFGCIKSLELLGRATLMAGERGLQWFVASEAQGLVEALPLLVKNARGAQVYPAIVQISYGVKEDPNLLIELCARLAVDKMHDPGGALIDAPNVAGHKLADPNTWDQHFTGELPHLVRVLQFVLRHNALGFTLGPHFLGGSPGNQPSTETADASSSS